MYCLAFRDDGEKLCDYVHFQNCWEECVGRDGQNCEEEGSILVWDAWKL